MTPMRKGVLGSIRLNSILQEFLNPPSAEKAEKEYGETTFRVGDKVMQIKNNYQIEWTSYNRSGIPVDKGAGVFNGDLGRIREINTFAELVTVEYDEGKTCRVQLQAAGGAGTGICDHDPQVAGKRVSGGRDSGLERTADADDAESDLHGGYKGKSLCLPGRCPVCVSADGGQCDGTEALFGTARPH